ncbi:MAG: hypothetical protein ACRC7N_04490, partial [Clostridium sp.]
MNNFWGLDKKEIISKINYIKENRSGYKEMIIYTDVVMKNKCLDKIYIDKSFGNRMNQIKEFESDKWCKYNADSYFEYAVIYRHNGYIAEYIELMEKVENSIVWYKNEYTELMYKDFGLFRGLQRIHALIINKKFDNIYSRVIKGKIDSYSKVNDVLWDSCSLDEVLYTLKIEADNFAGTNEIIHFQITMYTAIFFYLIDDRNRNEYKKIILNNAQKVIEAWNFSMEDEYIQLLDLSMEFPEIFGDILETPHKIVPADESLLSFNLVKPLTPLSKEEEESIKKMKKTSLKALMNKPKGIKKQKELIREYVVLRHNS